MDKFLSIWAWPLACRICGLNRISLFSHNDRTSWLGQCSKIINPFFMPKSSSYQAGGMTLLIALFLLPPSNARAFSDAASWVVTQRASLAAECPCHRIMGWQMRLMILYLKEWIIRTESWVNKTIAWKEKRCHFVVLITDWSDIRDIS